VLIICKKNKAFTLIELLVVVAIIGILAAVGVTAFNGFQESAKINVVKANHASVRTYIIGELLKCNLGESKVMSGYLTCSERFTALKVTKATTKSLEGNFKNPYDQIKDVAIKMSSKNYCRSDEEGNNMLNDDGYLLTIRSCSKRDTKLIEDKIYIE
jgi:type IV pilus assembly protein PilA